MAMLNVILIIVIVLVLALIWQNGRSAYRLGRAQRHGQTAPAASTP
jgi:hypothetical protein